MATVVRIRLVFPTRAPAATNEALHAVAQHCVEALANEGVLVRLDHVAHANDGSPRADVALWWPEASGLPRLHDPRIDARLHVGLLFSVPPKPTSSLLAQLAAFDAVLVSNAAIKAKLEALVREAGAPALVVREARLPSTPPPPRETEKALRGVSNQLVAYVDVRPYADELERLVVQIGLLSSSAVVVLGVTDDGNANMQARLTSLCQRHGVSAMLCAGDKALVSSAAVVDMYIGAASIEERLLLAACRVAVFDVDADVSSSLRQLAATLDRHLRDADGLVVRGLSLHEQYFGSTSTFLTALNDLSPRSRSATCAWVPIGPHAAKASGDVKVDAREAAPAPTTSIDDQLADLKRRLNRGTP